MNETIIPVPMMHEGERSTYYAALLYSVGRQRTIQLYSIRSRSGTGRRGSQRVHPFHFQRRSMKVKYEMDSAILL